MSEYEMRASRATAAALAARRLHEDAAAAYAAHLRDHPDDQTAWVSYGDCMMALGDPSAALLLWREAERGAAPSAALMQRLGDALAALGRSEDAAIAWARALAIDPAHMPAREALLAAAAPAALRALDRSPGDDAAAPLPQLLFDVSDLFAYWTDGNRLPTGIQRVQIEVARAAIARAAVPMALVVFDPETTGFRRIGAEAFVALAKGASDGAQEDPAWRQALANALAGMVRQSLTDGAVLLNLGTSWWLPDYMRQILNAKRRHGLRYVPLLHDCIPLLLAEHCAAGLVDEFARWFAGLCVAADAVICNSRCTEADFLKLREHLAPGSAAPTTVVRLDAFSGGAVVPSAPGRPYVLCVGTIESRKNHLMLFQAWLSLARRHGLDAIPDLVCVGKRGWLSESALALHANASGLRERVRIRHGVGDAELAALYAGCLFTIQNSHYEGWGLPVTESLGHGKVPLIPDHSGFRESGAGGAVFFTPGSEPDLLEKLETLIFDAGARVEAEARIARLRLRDWGAVAADILGAADAAAGIAMPPRVAFSLGDDLPLRLLPGPTPSLAMAAAEAVRDGPGWHRLEAWGVWTRPGIALLRLPLGTGVVAKLRLHLALRTAGAALTLKLRANGAHWRRVALPAGAAATLVIEVAAGAEDAVVVELDAGEGVPLPEGRSVGIGVERVMLCRYDDLAARLEWLEAGTLPNLIRL